MAVRMMNYYHSIQKGIIFSQKMDEINKKHKEVFQEKDGMENQKIITEEIINIFIIKNIIIIIIIIHNLLIYLFSQLIIIIIVYQIDFFIDCYFACFYVTANTIFNKTYCYYYFT